MSVENTAKELAAAFRGKQTPTAYDTSATVTRVEGDTLWVHIPGGVDETPVKRTVGASIGDEIQIRVGGGRAWAVGNASAPPTDDTRANYAVDLADEAINNANVAYNAAVSAQASAMSAQESAETASAAAEQASSAASTADAKAVQAAEAAATADSKAVQAANAAATADAKAVAAQNSANSAATAASNAQTSANNASQAAHSALTQLSTVEDVVGTLNWISEHGTYVATTDTEVVSGKLYFTRTGSGTEQDPYVYTVVTNPTGNPSTSGYFELDSVDEAVSNYVASHLALTDEGLYVINDQNGWRVLIKNDGVYIIDDSGTTVAKYKNVVTIGEEEKTHVNIDYHSLQLVDKDGNTYFYVSDLRDTTGYADIEDHFTGDGRTVEFYFSAPCNHIVSVTINQSDFPSTGYTITENFITFATAPSSSSDIAVLYRSASEELKAYTMGKRVSDSRIGLYSYAEGSDITADGSYSHAEGLYTTASGYVSHAEGLYTTASGYASHAEGFHTTAEENTHAEGFRTTASGPYSHAEGSHTTSSGQNSHAEGQHTTASSIYSHAEGRYTTAGGMASHAEGYYTIAWGQYQHAGGKYNIKDTNDLYAEIIGNGTADDARSNARTLDWNGNEWLAGNLTINGSTDVGAALANAVPNTRTVNGKPLSTDITLSASDVGAVDKTGDTMTGSLAIKDATIDATLTHMSNYWGTGCQYNFVDKNGVDIGHIRPFVTSSDQQGMYFEVSRDIHGTTMKNYLRLAIDGSGNQVVLLPAAAWRSALGVSQNYSKTVTGTTDANGFITLSLANGSYIPLVARSSHSDDHVEFTSGSSSWWGRVTNRGVARANTSVTIDVYYTDKP